MFDIILIHPIVNLLVVIYHLFIFLHIPSALGFSIIALTCVIRGVLVPFTNASLRSSKQMQELTPHLTKVKERHKGDSQRIQQETMRLYKEHGVNPFMGCLPMLLQIPIAWSLYSVLQKVAGLAPKEIVSYINGIVYHPSLALTHAWDTMFLGIPLGKSPHALWGTFGIFVLLLPLITAALQFIQSKMMLPKPTGEKIAKKKDGQDDFAQAFQTQSLYLIPVMIGYASFNFPLALSLYWNTFTIFGILQQYLLHGAGGLTGSMQQMQQLWKKTK